TEIPASSATSWRRRPGVRRLPPPGSPTSAGRRRFLRVRRNAASSARFMVPACPIAARARRAQGGTAGPSFGRALPPGRARAEDEAMTTTVLITGANKGIGRHTAGLLGARGMTVLVGARDAGRGRQAQQ